MRRGLILANKFTLVKKKSEVKKQRIKYMGNTGTGSRVFRKLFIEPERNSKLVTLQHQW